MTLNGSDAYLPVHDDSPFVIVFDGTQCGESWFLEWTDAEPVDCYIFENGNVFLVPERNVLTKRKRRKTLFEHLTKIPSFKVQIVIEEPGKPLAIFVNWQYYIVHPCRFVHT